jgi:hypothetical protein
VRPDEAPGLRLYRRALVAPAQALGSIDERECGYWRRPHAARRDPRVEAFSEGFRDAIRLREAATRRRDVAVLAVARRGYVDVDAGVEEVIAIAVEQGLDRLDAALLYLNVLPLIHGLPEVGGPDLEFYLRRLGLGAAEAPLGSPGVSPDESEQCKRHPPSSPLIEIAAAALRRVTRRVWRRFPSFVLATVDFADPPATEFGVPAGGSRRDNAGFARAWGILAANCLRYAAGEGANTGQEPMAADLDQQQMAAVAGIALVAEVCSLDRVEGERTPALRAARALARRAATVCDELRSLARTAIEPGFGEAQRAELVGGLRPFVIADEDDDGLGGLSARSSPPSGSIEDDAGANATSETKTSPSAGPLGSGTHSPSSRADGLTLIASARSARRTRDPVAKEQRLIGVLVERRDLWGASESQLSAATGMSRGTIGHIIRRIVARREPDDPGRRVIEHHLDAWDGRHAVRRHGRDNRSRQTRARSRDGADLEDIGSFDRRQD